MESLQHLQTRVLWIVLLINLGMFAVELIAGFISDSTALLGESLDMLGDALAYGSSIYVVKRSLIAKAKAAKFKAILILATGFGFMIQAIYRSIAQDVPDWSIMGGIGFLALIANTACLVLLTKHKKDDINFRSVWLCSRNDIIANLAVLGAAAGVGYFQSPWPDLIVGFGILFLFLRSGFFILKEARTRGHT